MDTSLTIDNQLLEIAFHIGGFKTPKETVNIALEEFIKKRKVEELIDVFHTIDFNSDYDYKKLRHRQ